MTINEKDSEIKKKINECYLQILDRPVDRAYSQYNMFLTKGKESLSFEEALEFEKL